LLDADNNNNNTENYNNRIGINSGNSSNINYHYLAAQKYCRGWEIYLFYNKGIFCPCCVRQLRTTPTTKIGRDKLMKYRLKHKK
jgi:hypothetical protein